MVLFVVEFDLKTRSPITVENGDVIVDKGCRTVTVRNLEADLHEDAINKARPKAEAFLDELCWRHAICLEMGTSYTVAPQDSPAIRHIKQFVLKVKLKGGHRERFQRKLKEVVIRLSESKALYRKAAISQDPRDRFREFFLVIENIASKLVKDAGSEEELLRKALEKCFSSRFEELENFVREWGFPYKGNIVDEVARDLYRNYRLPLFHAKANRLKKIPFNPEDEQEIERILPLAEFIAKSFISYEHGSLPC